MHHINKVLPHCIQRSLNDVNFVIHFHQYRYICEIQSLVSTSLNYVAARNIRGIIAHSAELGVLVHKLQIERGNVALYLNSLSMERVQKYPFSFRNMIPATQERFIWDWCLLGLTKPQEMALAARNKVVKFGWWWWWWWRLNSIRRLFTGPTSTMKLIDRYLWGPPVAFEY